MPDQPIVVAYGIGVDSTAMLVGLHRRGIRPDLILFADTGGEKPDTYLYAPIIRQWLRNVDFPQFEEVRYRPPIAPYDPLYQHWYPLMDWQMDREACKRLIADAGLPVPVTSACFFCPASKRHEVVQLSFQTPSLHRAALVPEDRYRDGKH